MRGLYNLLLLTLGCGVHAQYLAGVHVVQDNRVDEWVVLGEEEDDGILRVLWQLRNDWTEWEFSFAGVRGDIIMRQKNNPGFWEARAQGLVVTARALWPNDLSQWQITSGEIRVNLSTRFGHQADEWFINDRKWGKLNMFVEYDGDPRSWIIEDDLDTSVPSVMKILITHLVIFNSMPRS